LEDAEMRLCKKRAGHSKTPVKTLINHESSVHMEWQSLQKQNTKVSKAWNKAAELDRISVIAVPDDMYAVVRLPRSFSNKRRWVMTQQAYDDLKRKKTT